MNSQQLTSLLRIVLQWAGAFIVSKGWSDDSTVTAVSGAVLTLATAAWSLYARRSAGLVAAAAALPEVARITADPKIARTVPSKKVQAA